MDIGFLGLGNMGAPMARNLLRVFSSVTVYDVVPEAMRALVEAGASPATSVAELAGASPDVVVTMLPGPAQVRTTYLGEAGLIARSPVGTLFADCSTIDPVTARELAQAAQARGSAMLDAPVSGGTNGAQAATLTFMVGGARAAFDSAKPVLAAMGKNLVHCGPAGSGQATKLANNMLLGISMIGVAEAMSLGVALGVDAKVLAGVINSSSGHCWSSEVYNPHPDVLENSPAARGYSGGFSTDLMLKDLGLASEAARSARQPVMLGALAHQVYQSFSQQGNGMLDFSAIIMAYELPGGCSKAGARLAS